MGRTLRAAAAGAAAAGFWAAAEPGLRRFSHSPHSEPRLVGRMLAPERYWLPVGLSVHVLNGAAFGVVFDRLGGRGIASAIPGPMATTTAPTATAGTSPSTKCCGAPYPPRSEKIVPNTATPNTPPSSRMAFAAPEALPSSRRATEPSTTCADGA